ncbi:WhiB family transcriptional regulator [Streptomyces solincola]|uniref:WhiB family transcriptional regulator n=1 Tax=Streptomyces solincola TaxID=2100817 RepID=UPI0015E37C44|nr:WhiB family transcriptional regulator [Streptomyces solincola]
MKQPNCRGHDPEIFYERARWPEAKTICEDCPLLLECRATFQDDPWPFAGGMTPNQRVTWSRSTKARVFGRCVRCGFRFQEAPRAGRPRMYCSTECRQAAYAAGETQTKRQPLAKISIDTELEAVSLWHQGYGLKRAAKALGISESSVRRIFDGHGLKRTQAERDAISGQAGAMAAQARADVGRMVRKLLAEGQQSPQEIALLANCAVNTVYKIRKGMAA